MEDSFLDTLSLQVLRWNMIFCVVFLDFLQLVKVERYGVFGGRLYDLMVDCVDYHTCEGVPETPLHRVGTTIQRSGQPLFFFVCEDKDLFTLNVTVTVSMKITFKVLILCQWR